MFSSVSSLALLLIAGATGSVLAGQPIARAPASSHPDAVLASVASYRLNHIIDVAAADTNARRFARGLPPVAPREFGRRDQQHVRRQGGSSLPGLTSPITVVRESDGFVLGQIAKKLSDYNTFMITTDPSKAASFTRPAGKKTNFDIAVAGEGEPNIGGVFGLVDDNGENMGPGSGSYAFVAPVQASVGPAFDTDNAQGLPSESNIWSFDAATLELTAKWTNTDNSRVGVVLFHDLQFDDLDFTGDLTAFDQTFPSEGTEAVRFYFGA